MNNEEKILALLGQINGRLDRMEGRLDLDVGKRLDALAEGQDMIVQRLGRVEGTLDEVKELAEETSEKVDVIHAVVAQHSKSITELKQAK